MIEDFFSHCFLTSLREFASLSVSSCVFTQLLNGNKPLKWVEGGGSGSEEWWGGGKALIFTLKFQSEEVVCVVKKVSATDPCINY